MKRCFIDTNIFIYHLTHNHPLHSPRCTALMERIEAGELHAVTAITAIDETLRVLTRTFGQSRENATAALALILSQPEVGIDHRQAVLEAMAFWAEQSPLSFADCYHLALTKSLGMIAIYTFDQKMDRFPGVERLEP